MRTKDKDTIEKILKEVWDRKLPISRAKLRLFSIYMTNPDFSKQF